MKWNLSYNERSFISDQTYEMFGLKMDNLVTKETTNSRKGRDDSDEQNLLNTLKSFNVFNEISDYLINIATKDVATDEIQESLLKAEYKGEICMTEFIKRITQRTESILADEFYKNIERNNTNPLKIFTLKMASLKVKKRVMS